MADTEQQDVPDVDPRYDEYVKKLEENESKSLMKKHFLANKDAVKTGRTALGGTICDCIKSGVDNLDSGCGIYACDPGAYETFKAVFDPLICEYHKKDAVAHPASDFGDPDNLGIGNPDPAGKYIVSTRIRVGRSVDDVPFPPCITDKQRESVETRVVEALNSMPGDLGGKYYSLTKMTKAENQKLIDDHFLFKNDDRFLESADGYKNWPNNRGIFHNENQTFLVWLNEEDHIRIISMQKGGNIDEVFARLVRAVNHIQEKGGITFARSDRHGYLTFCPTNIGTTLRASVHIRIPLASQHADFKEFCDKYQLQPRGIHGEHTESVGGIYDVSNKGRMGMTEYEAVKVMATGCEKLIEWEKELEKNMTGDQMMSILEGNKDCKSLLKKHCTRERYEKLKDAKTSLNGTLADCMRSGVENLDSGTGIYACDPEAYETFRDVFDPIIAEYHNCKTPEHPEAGQFGDLDSLPFGDLDPENKYVVSTRVRVGRSVDGFPFPPTITEAQRTELAKKVEAALTEFEGEQKGTYYPLQGMKADVQKQLTEDHFLFNDSDRFLGSAGGYKDWPSGRGIFHNESKSFLLWLNEEDHIRIISMQMGGNLGEVYKRLVDGIKQIESKVPFAKNPRLGYLTFCPTNLGTTCRASVHVKIPLFSQHPSFKEMCAKWQLQPRGIHGEHTESVGGVYDISNKRRLGLTEFDAVKEMAEGVKNVIEMEQKLERGEKVQAPGPSTSQLLLLVGIPSAIVLIAFLKQKFWS